MPAPGLLSAVQVCERALRKIQAFSINDTAARPEHLHEALHWLGLLLDHLGGTQRRYWLLSETLSIPLQADIKDYDNIDTLISADWPANGVGHPVIAWLENQEGTYRRPVEIVRREKFEAVSNPVKSGDPCYLYFSPKVDPDLSPKMSVFPVPAVNTLVVRMIFELMPNRVAPANTVGSRPRPTAKMDHGLRRPWQMWAITALAAEIGDGPVRALPGDRIGAWRRQAKEMLDELATYEDTEHQTTDPIVAPGWDYGEEDIETRPGVPTDYGNRSGGW